MDGRILRAIIENYQGGPVGLSTIAVAVGEDKGTIEEVYEPFLIQEGFLQRTPKGRVATLKAFEFIGVNPGQRQADLFNT
jgi:holliday junction DNA helicase RuvB